MSETRNDSTAHVEPSTEAPANPDSQAQGNANPDIGKLISDALREQRDSIFAELRRTGVLESKKAKPKSEASSEAATSTPVDALKLRELDRAVTRAGHAERLDGNAYRRLERAFVEEAPQDAENWVKDYFAGFGFAKEKPSTINQNTNNPTVNVSRNEHPVSDRGVPPASKIALEDQDLVSMTESDRAALIKTKGIRWYVNKLTEQQKTKVYRLR